MTAEKTGGEILHHCTDYTTLVARVFNYTIYAAMH